MYFAPESPWWLVRHGKLDEAEKSVRRLASKEMKERAHETVANMVRTNQMEMDFAQSHGQGSWLDLFRGTNLRRTEITVLAWMGQNLCGCIFCGGTTYVFEQAGISQQQAFDLGLGTSAIQLAANFVNYYLMYWFGRRTLYLVGFAYSDVLLVAIGVVAVYGARGVTTAKWAQAGLQMVGGGRGGGLISSGFHDGLHWVPGTGESSFAHVSLFLRLLGLLCYCG